MSDDDDSPFGAAADRILTDFASFQIQLMERTEAFLEKLASAHPNTIDVRHQEEARILLALWKGDQ